MGFAKSSSVTYGDTPSQTEVWEGRKAPPREDINSLSTLTLRVLPPKGDRKAKDRNTPSRPAKLSTHLLNKYRRD